MDLRLIFVFFPVLAAASWALYNIGRVALQQYKKIASR
nr:Photosystem II reaction center protein Y [Scytothamnus australis]WAM64723.1 Photosystem II reaction center protein Y [Scytothamnus australis]